VPGKTKLVEATSGNTGIALSSAAAKLSCECAIIMPRNMSEQRKHMMKAFGTTIIQVGDNDFQGAIEKRNEILEEDQNTWAPMQFENELNVECHYETTAPEIHLQTLQEKLEWSAYVHGAGTGGTMMGIKKYIDFKNLGVECVLTVPAETASEHGIQGINDGADFLLDKKLMDHTVKVKTSDAIERMQQFAKTHGLLVGISSGANLIAAEEYAQKMNKKGIVITMLCDRGERYL
jgi:cysteine synthase A